MVYRIVGNEGCTRCGVVLEILRKRGVNYTYHYMSDEEDKIAEEISVLAMFNGITTLPLIYNETTAEFIELEDIE